MPRDGSPSSPYVTIEEILQQDEEYLFQQQDEYEYEHEIKQKQQDHVYIISKCIKIGKKLRFHQNVSYFFFFFFL